MVAPSFKDFPIVKEQYVKGGKYYVDVKNPKTGTDAEFAKNYGKKFEDRGCTLVVSIMVLFVVLVLLMKSG